MEDLVPLRRTGISAFAPHSLKSGMLARSAPFRPTQVAFVLWYVSITTCGQVLTDPYAVQWRASCRNLALHTLYVVTGPWNAGSPVAVKRARLPMGILPAEQMGPAGAGNRAGMFFLGTRIFSIVPSIYRRQIPERKGWVYKIRVRNGTCSAVIKTFT